MRYILLLLCCLLSFTLFAGSDSLHVYFETGKSSLTHNVQEQLSTYVYNDVIHAQQQLQIIGYADYVGDNPSNNQLSRLRAQSVKNYLIKLGFSEKDIAICIGKGKVKREGMIGNEGFTHDRRVDIVAIITMKDMVIQEPLPPVINAGPKLQSMVSIATLKPDETFIMNKIYFLSGRHRLRPESLPALDQLYDQLMLNPKVRIRIEGHVCCVKPSQPDAIDEDLGSLDLSVNRARFIYNYLIKKGIPANRISYQGFGSRRKIVPVEETEEDADKNRRVEIRIL